MVQTKSKIMKNIFLLSLFITLITGTLPMYAQVITTIAGDSTGGFNGDGIPAISAELFNPNDMAIDNAGNIFVADGNNNRIRKINTAGIITTIAGTGTAGYNGDGIAATLAELSYPTSIILDDSGNIYITDDHNYRIRK